MCSLDVLVHAHDLAELHHGLMSKNVATDQLLACYSYDCVNVKLGHNTFSLITILCTLYFLLNLALYFSYQFQYLDNTIHIVERSNS